MYKLIFDDYAQNINEIDVNGLTKKNACFAVKCKKNPIKLNIGLDF